MIIALVFQGNHISRNYGRSEGVKIYNISNNKIVSTKTIMNADIKGGEIASLLAAYNVEIVIVGGIGEFALQNLHSLKIKVISGIEGEINHVLKNFCENNINMI